MRFVIVMQEKIVTDEGSNNLDKEGGRESTWMMQTIGDDATVLRFKDIL